MNDAKQRAEAVGEELRELEESIAATDSHGIVYYSLLVAIIFLAIAVGYAAGAVWGIVVGALSLALVVLREVVRYRARTTALRAVIAEKRRERDTIEEHSKGD